MFAIASEAIEIALIPSSGETPAWAGFPFIVTFKVSWAGPIVVINPGSPLVSKRNAFFALIFE